MRRHPARQDPKRWAKVRLAVLDRAGWRCQLCGRYGNEADHIVPVHKGGAWWDMANLRCACRTCNIGRERKRDPAREAWRALLEARLSG